jgi:hypothetical protein
MWVTSRKCAISWRSTARTRLSIFNSLEWKRYSTYKSLNLTYWKKRGKKYEDALLALKKSQVFKKLQEILGTVTQFVAWYHNGYKRCRFYHKVFI